MAWRQGATIGLTVAALGFTLWRLVQVGNLLTGIILVILAAMTAIVLGPLWTSRYAPKTQWTVRLSMMILMWIVWLYFFEVLAYFGLAAVFSSWWAISDRRRQSRSSA